MKLHMAFYRNTVAGLLLTGVVSLANGQDANTPKRPHFTPEQIFKQWDKNADGKLSGDEIPNANLLKLLDKNGDGTVTKDEAAAIGKWGAGPGGPAGRGSPDNCCKHLDLA